MKSKLQNFIIGKEKTTALKENKHLLEKENILKELGVKMRLLE